MENKAGEVRKGAWTAEEDMLLRKCIEKHGEGKWHQVPFRAGLNRCRKSCRLRWLNYLKPDIKRGHFTRDEVDLIIRLHNLLGNRWSLITGRLPGRTANDVKNFWNTHIERKQSAAASASAVVSGESNNNGEVKAITARNILRPRPRTFTTFKAPAWQTELVTGANQAPNDYEIEKANKNFKPSLAPSSSVKNCVSGDNETPKNNHLPSSSSTQEAAEESIRWWSKLLEATESGEIGIPSTFPDVDLQIDVPISSPGLGDANSYANQGGTSGSYLDVDIWDLL